MTFKAQLRADVAATFLNRDEFARTVRIGDVEVAGLWSDTVETYQDYHHESLPRLPLDAGERILEIASGVLEIRPGQEVEVDGEVWTLRKSIDWDGMALLYLYQHEMV